MTIQLISKKYHFNGGSAVVYRADWARLPEGSAMLLNGDCIDNTIRNVEITESAEYEVWLSYSRVDHVAISGGLPFTQVTPWRAKITPTDLLAGETVLEVPQQHLFKVTALQHGAPLAVRKMTFHLEMRSIEVQLDDKGAVTIIDDPSELLGIQVQDNLSINVERLA